MNQKKKIIIIFFGPPGSGKGTQAAMLGEYLKLPAISLGELFRRESLRKGKLAKTLKEIMSRGKLVPQEIVEDVMDKRLREKDARAGFILDGYPRKKIQLEKLSERLRKILKPGDHALAILVDVSDREVKKRLSKRRVCACGAAYHLEFKPPRQRGNCDFCGGRLITREDDKPEVIADRLKLYHKENKPLIKYWEKQGRLIRIRGEQAIGSVKKDIIAALKKELK